MIGGQSFWIASRSRQLARSVIYIVNRLEVRCNLIGGTLLFEQIEFFGPGSGNLGVTAAKHINNMCDILPVCLRGFGEAVEFIEFGLPPAIAFLVLLCGFISL